MDPLRRVTHSSPCPVCAKPDWCGYNSKIAICMRVPSERQAANGGHIHELDGSGKARYLPLAREYMRVAPVGARHHWYAAVAKAFPLTTEDLAALGARGLTEESIRRNGYASLPAHKERQPIIDRLVAAQGSDPGHIPGFYQDTGGRWCLAGSAGLLLPIRDQNFLIQGYQVRRSDAQVQKDQGPRYVWVSSAGNVLLPDGQIIERNGGTSSGTPAHHHRVPGTTLWITEGAFKADIIHQTYGTSAIGLSGVGTWRAIQNDPMVSLERTRTIVVAFDDDPDPKTQAHVTRARDDLTAALQTKGFNVQYARWDGPYAKIDDALTHGAKVWLQQTELALTR